MLSRSSELSSQTWQWKYSYFSLYFFLNLRSIRWMTDSWVDWKVILNVPETWKMINRKMRENSRWSHIKICRSYGCPAVAGNVKQFHYTYITVEERACKGLQIGPIRRNNCHSTICPGGIWKEFVNESLMNQRMTFNVDEPVIFDSPNSRHSPSASTWLRTRPSSFKMNVLIDY
jgi:hypothetical protein